MFGILLTATGLIFFALIAALLLYARGIAKSVNEPLWQTLKSIVAAVIAGEFF